MDNHPLNTSLYGNPLISVISDEGEAEVAAGPVAQALSGVVHNNHGEPTQLNQAESHQSGQNSLPTREDSRRGKQVFKSVIRLLQWARSLPVMLGSIMAKGIKLVACSCLGSQRNAQG